MLASNLTAAQTIGARQRLVQPTIVNNVTVTTFQLTSSSGGASLPFAIGQAFKEGDVTNVAALGADTPVQITPKNYWPGGSLKYAIVSGRKTLTAGVPSTVTLSTAGSVAPGSNRTLADLKATGITASITFGSFGTASWSGTDWDAPNQTLTAGPELSVWTFRKPIGSDAHLVAWLEVRLFADGNVQVLPWVENGYLSVSSPGQRAGATSFTLGGSQRFSQSLTLLNHTRAVLASGTTLTHWLNTDPAVVPKHNAAYLMSTKLVPNYLAVTGSSSPLYSRLPTTYTPLDQGPYPPLMGQEGYHGSIGILPEWDVAYLTTGGDPRAWTGLIISSYLGGRYGTHFRDQNTQRPISFTTHPNLVVSSTSNMGGIGTSATGTYTPDATGTQPPYWGSAHQPSIGFFAYLVTGWNYHLEEMQFLATANYMRQESSTQSGSASSGRGGANGIFITESGQNTTRGAGWAIRTLAQTVAITPDADPLRTSWLASLNANINYYYNRYAASAGNPLGLVEPYDDYSPGSNPWEATTFMEDFFTQALGYTKELNAHTSANLDALLAWKYKSVIGRLGGTASTEFSYRWCATYAVNYAPTDSATWTPAAPGPSPGYADWGEVARAMGIPQDGSPGAGIPNGSSGGYPDSPGGRVSNMLPALCYAIDHGATGAAAAWARISTASNWNAHTALYNDDPVWGVRPRTV